MEILGLNCFGHDASAALIRDGRVIAMAEQERFNREKHTYAFAGDAIKYCLKEGGISLSDVERVVFYYHPLLGAARRIPYMIFHLPGSLAMFKGKRMFQGGSILNMQRHFKELFPRQSRYPKITFIPHHLAHAASAFFCSPFPEAAILSMDGTGEWTTTWMGIGRGNKIQPLRQVSWPHSLGMWYGAITEYLGFKIMSGEGKVMGLASYGKPSFYEKLKKTLLLLPDGNFKIDTSYFDYHIKWLGGNYVSDKFIREFGPARGRESAIEPRHEDIAHSLQLLFEDALLHIAGYIKQATGADNLCIGGGVGLNCVGNGKLLKSGMFKDIYVQAAPGESGTSIGGALYYYYQMRNNPRDRIYHLATPFLGPEFSNEECRRAIDKHGLKATLSADICAEAAKLLSQNKIIGWFQGRMEFGPRALGNRSILADPRGKDTKDILNKRVKHREPFRPFAPAVLIEDCSRYFDYAYPSSFMSFVYNVREDKRGEVPAITHVDGTGRVQTVSEKDNPRFYRLIREFKQLTGVSLVLNTSFNVRGEPIVCTPEDAISCFLHTDMDYLILGDHLIGK
jgi:carbamoyltransferase